MRCARRKSRKGEGEVRREEREEIGEGRSVREETERREIWRKGRKGGLKEREGKREGRKRGRNSRSEGERKVNREGRQGER